MDLRTGLKTEGTTTTFGQRITAVIPVLPVTQGVRSVPVTVTQVGSEQNSTGVVPDGVKAQAALAAVTDQKNKAIVVPSDTPPTNTEDLGSKDKTEQLFVLQGISLTTDVIKKVLLESQKVDLSISIKSKDSLPLEFNSLQTIEHGCQFTYQSWIPEESDILSQEDPKKDPLLNKKIREVPRFVEIKWEPVTTKEQLTETVVSNSSEVKDLKEQVLNAPRGIQSSSGAETYKPLASSLKSINSVSNGTIKAKIVDIHQPDKGFENIVNKTQFNTSIKTIVNIP